MQNNPINLQQQQNSYMNQQKIVINPIFKGKTRHICATKEDIQTQFKALLLEIRSDLNNLQRLHKAFMLADNFDLKYYIKENKKNGESYIKIQEEVNELSRKSASDELVNELTIISNRLNLDIDNINALFPQMIYTSVSMRKIMEIKVNQIGYPEIHSQAEVAYSQLVALEPNLRLKELNEGDENSKINSAIRVISALNEMRAHKKEIIILQQQDDDKASKTRRNILGGMASVLIIIAAFVFGLFMYEIAWDDIRDFPILGIPLGIIIWAFIGSFAAMLQQFYQKSIYEFGDTLKWVLIRPVLGMVMGAAIYLAFSNGLGINTDTGNGGLIYLVAFFVGLSDSFTLGLIEKLQGAITSSVVDQSPNKEVPVINQPNLANYNNNNVNETKSKGVNEPLQIETNPFAEDKLEDGSEKGEDGV